MTISSFRPHHGVRPLVAAVAVVGVLAGAGTSSAAEPGSCPDRDAAPTAANREQIEAATVCLVNAERIAHGLKPLRPDPRLEQAAHAHNDDMQARGYFSHTSPEGSTGADRRRATGYPGDAGENLLKGTVTPAEAVALWLDSPSHRAVILEPAYRGVGTAQGGKYWTQTLGQAEPPGGSGPSEAPAGSGARSPSGAQGGGGNGGSGEGGVPSPEGTGGSPGGLGSGGNGGSGGGTFEATGLSPAKLQVVHVRVRRGRLDALATVDERAHGDAVRVSFIANGRRFSFTERIEQGRLRFRQRLPRSQRAVSTGMMEIHYAGNERLRPAEVRLRAARRSARLEPQVLSLHGGVLRAHGTINRRARGLVRLRLSTGGGDAWTARARIANGTWQLRATLPPALREGGYLTIAFTGYRPARIRGAQTDREVLSD